MSRRKKGKAAHGEGSIYQRSDGRWAAVITTGFDDEGRQKRRFVYGKTQSDVRVKLQKMRAAQDAGTLPKPNRREVGEYVDEWIRNRAHNWSARTLEMYEYEASAYISPHLGGVALKKLTPADVEKAVAKIAVKHGPRTAQKVHGLLKRVMGTAVAHNLIPRNPVEFAEPPKVPEPEVRPVPLADLRRFLKEVEGTRWAAMFHLFAVTGLRRGELLGLTWADITPRRIVVRQTLKVVDNKTVITPRGKTANAARSFPITSETHAVLMAHKRLQEQDRSALGWPDSDLVFPNTVGKPQNPANIYHRVMYPIQDRLKIDRFNLHQLRHTYSAMMIRSGADPKLLAERLGHARASFTLDRYGHLFDEQRDQLAYGLDELMGGEEPS